MNVLIITGGSNGIGKAIAEKYTLEKHTVFSISRSKTTNVSYQQITADLSNTSEAVNTIKTVFSELDLNAISSITLLNNAGSLGEVNTVGNLDFEKIQQTIQLNTITPLVLSNEFIKLTKELHCKKQIINISSGAATSPYSGWSIYCTSKAALDMTTRVIAIEQNEVDNDVKCVAIYPGVVDTNMQAAIRKTSEKEFKNVQHFKELKENNELYSPEFVATKVYQIDIQNQLENGDIVDIRTV
ncbi:Benzil reductase ((S)-benzoin forming) [Polaribacter huanghezhanensis]|uniref:SDR family NAD(P)-dependent oxidoreductase n=1 Tax=Polaribacter huanghezhanensis TaxID=1354726 RepID=UPI002648D983|nr:SDR family NAD(P)-dependent oxidoreductase [Polaribacter huanghezhanensis]WKD87004.1 Benzil reductase ((S)-benzoin forming) [Polaribacter huanghezhanensis]